LCIAHTTAQDLSRPASRASVFDRDPLSLRDVQEVETAFAGADAETACQID